ncbi:MAG: hypothetical protein HYX60_11465 [Legionella longbeachae]|nr:hypothetical protein [Legionella longbeachae]
MSWHDEVKEFEQQLQLQLSRSSFLNSHYTSPERIKKTELVASGKRFLRGLQALIVLLRDSESPELTPLLAKAILMLKNPNQTDYQSLRQHLKELKEYLTENKEQIQSSINGRVGDSVFGMTSIIIIGLIGLSKATGDIATAATLLAMVPNLLFGAFLLSAIALAIGITAFRYNRVDQFGEGRQINNIEAFVNLIAPQKVSNETQFKQKEKLNEEPTCEVMYNIQN